MEMTLRQPWQMFDFSKRVTDPGKRTLVPAGTHEVERIAHPWGFTRDGDTPITCIVLKGTQIGMAEGAVAQWAPGQTVDKPDHPDYGQIIDWGELTIEITGGGA
ncbi:MAG: hypothetical protein Q7S96_02010 [bacterium]|nr:hypothetical protein [bacterium]